MSVQFCVINNWNQYTKSDQTMVKCLFRLSCKVGEMSFTPFLSGFCHFGPCTEPWYSRHLLFSCERAASGVLEPCALSSTCLVSCWSVVFGFRHSSLEFCVGVQTLALHVLSHCVSVRSRVRSLFCPRVFCCVAHSLCFYRLRAFMLCLVLCGTQLVFFIGCMLSCCHVLCEHVDYEFSH